MVLILNPASISWTCVSCRFGMPRFWWCMLTESFYKKVKANAMLVRNNISVAKRAMELLSERQYLESAHPMPVGTEAAGKPVRLDPETRAAIEMLCSDFVRLLHSYIPSHTSFPSFSLFVLIMFFALVYLDSAPWNMSCMSNRDLLHSLIRARCISAVSGAKQGEGQVQARQHRATVLAEVG